MKFNKKVFSNIDDSIIESESTADTTRDTLEGLQHELNSVMKAHGITAERLMEHEVVEKDELTQILRDEGFPPPASQISGNGG